MAAVGMFASLTRSLLIKPHTHTPDDDPQMSFFNQP